MGKSILYFIIILLYLIKSDKAKYNSDNKFLLNKTEVYYENLFNSIDNDFYNLSLIYKKSYNSIKIKHKTNKNKSNKEICVFGVLVNDKGLQIEKSLLSWLLPEYDVYCVYQKFPGILFEYPALRFAQWFTIKENKSITLYIHTKGAFNQNLIQEKIRAVWKHEFTSPRKYIYIDLIKKNLTDVSTLYRNGKCTWYNGLFFSNRAFHLLPEIQYESINRYYYECLFKSSNKIRLKGILNNSISIYVVSSQNSLFLEFFEKEENIRKCTIKKNFLILNGLLLIMIILKKMNFLKVYEQKILELS